MPRIPEASIIAGALLGFIVGIDKRDSSIHTIVIFFFVKNTYLFCYCKRSN